MLICIFEDEFYGRLLPLAYMRPVFDLRCGQLTLRDKIARSYPDDIFVLHTRSYLRDCVKERHPGSFVNELPKDADRLLLINGRILYNSGMVSEFGSRGEDTVYREGDVILAAWISGRNLQAYGQSISRKLVSGADFAGIRNIDFSGTQMINFPWDLVNLNGDQLVSDFAVTAGGQPQILGRVYDGAHLINRPLIHVGKGAKIKPGSVVDAEDGPVYIARDVEIMPNVVVRGPVFIGAGSVAKAGAKIYESTSIGEVCKIGGEVEGSIIHGHSNKQHDGFLGHSYIAEWVNIGAGSNTSDLKNDYGNVRVFNQGSFVDTGSRFVGLTMADHSKCGINSTFNTGTVVSVCCNIFGLGTPPKFVPAFSWGEPSKGFVTYKLERAVDVAHAVTGRRNVQFSPAEELLLKKVFDLTAAERASAGVSP